MEEDKYPYLGKTDINGQSCIVLFSAENYGTVVMSEITNNNEYMLGAINDFDEEEFEFLNPEVVVRLNN